MEFTSMAAAVTVAISLLLPYRAHHEKLNAALAEREASMRAKEDLLALREAQLEDQKRQNAQQAMMLELMVGLLVGSRIPLPVRTKKSQRE